MLNAQSSVDASLNAIRSPTNCYLNTMPGMIVTFRAKNKQTLRVATLDNDEYEVYVDSGSPLVIRSLFYWNYVKKTHG